MINRVVLTGRLVANIELRQTSDATPYTFFTLAVTRSANRDKSDFVSCVAWRHTAEFMSNYMKKGSLIGVEGRVESYTTEVDGQNQTRLNINVSQVHFMESKAEAERRTGSTAEISFEREQQQPKTEIEVPTKESSFSKINQEETTNASNDINFDDIKF